MKFRLAQNEIIFKFMLNLNLHKTFGLVAFNHITEFLAASVLKGFNGKINDIAEISKNHRTTIGHFFNNGKWDEESLLKTIKTTVEDTILEKSQISTEPIFVSIDDTVNCKKKPSSQANHPIESASFHHSHLLGKQVWGHQVMATMLSCGDTALNFDVHQYDKIQSKIDYMIELASTLPIPTTKSYMLCDSWFTCPKIMQAFENQGYYCIGSLKTNRIIYPKGIHISISDFASEHIELTDVDLVTVNSKRYYVYRYEGSLNNIENAVVLISYPVDAFKNPKALKAFICTDSSLYTLTILEYYLNRWCIETFFKQEKNELGFDKYQIRSIKGIKRFWILTSLAHLLCVIGSGTPMSFSDGRMKIRKSIIFSTIEYIYKSAQNNMPFSVIIDEFIA